MKNKLQTMLWLLFVILTNNIMLPAQQKPAPDKATETDKYHYTREGNKLYKEDKFAEAESLYVKGGRHEPDGFTTAFNLGDALYKQGKYEQARQQFDLLVKNTASADTMSLVHHNIGNCLLQQKEYAQSIEAYKKALRLNPGDDEARYNLAYAQKMLEQQQKKQQPQNQQDPNQKEKDKDKEKDKKQKDEDQQKKDELEKKKKELQKEQQEKTKEKQQNKEKQQKPGTSEPERQQLEKQNEKIDRRLEQIQKEIEKIDRELQEKQGQPKPQSEIQKEEARRILEALKNEEKKTRNKLDKKSQNNSYPETEKDW